MNTSPPQIERTLVEFLILIEKHPEDFHANMPLYADGVGLDSLETAELSATLEDAHGADPFSAPEMPQTLNDIIAFYTTDSTHV